MTKKPAGKTVNVKRNSGAIKKTKNEIPNTEATAQDNFPFQAPSKKKPGGFKVGVLKSRH
jgi:hypothetical protein